MRVLLSLGFIACVSLANFSQAATATQASHAEVDKKKAVILAKKTIGGKTLKITEKNRFLYRTNTQI